jgi:hypothetical protein
MSKSRLPAPESPRAATSRQFVSTTAVEAFFAARRRAPGFDQGEHLRPNAVGAACG